MIRNIWLVLAVILPLVVVAELWMHPHIYFVIDGIPFFYAWYGFVACAVIVIVSKLLGYVLKRPTSYYKKRS